MDAYKTFQINNSIILINSFLRAAIANIMFGASCYIVPEDKMALRKQSTLMQCKKTSKINQTIKVQSYDLHCWIEKKKISVVHKSQINYLDQLHLYF